MAGDFSITVDATAVRRTFELYPEAAARKLNSLIEGGAIDLQSEIRRDAPVHDGQYRRSVDYKLNRGRFEANIGPRVKYAKPVETGSRPHWTSVKPGSSLRKWADSKGINPYAVQRSIAKKGTKAQWVVRDVFRRERGGVQRDIVTGFARFIGEVNANGLR